MKAHIGVDVDSGLVHTVTTTAANEADIEQVEELLHGKEEVVHADAGYSGADKRVERKGLRWEIAAKRGKVKLGRQSGHDLQRDAILKREDSLSCPRSDPVSISFRRLAIDSSAKSCVSSELAVSSFAAQSVRISDSVDRFPKFCACPSFNSSNKGRSSPSDLSVPASWVILSAMPFC
jgi:IS5 family transposase